MDFEFVIATSILSFLGIILHVFGIYLLRKVKRRNNNHNILITNLSIAEILLMLFFTTFRTIKYYDKGFYIGIAISLSIYAWISIAFHLSMILISFDRFLCSLLHVKYDYYITSKRVKKVIFAIWVISFFLMIIPYMFRIHCFNGICYYHLPLLLGGVFIIVSICAYGSIVHVILRGRKEFVHQTKAKRSIKRNLKMYTVPCSIIASFVIFYQIPLLVQMVAIKSHFNFSELTINLVHSCYMVGYLVDPFIYIFLDGKVRKVAISTICCSSCSLKEVNKQAGSGINDVLDDFNVRRHTNSTEASL